MTSHIRFLRWYAALAIVIASLVSCGDDEPTLPTVPSRPTVTDTFSGSIGMNGANSHTFLAGATGTITATLAAVGPDAVGADGTPLVVGFGVGTWNGSLCNVVLAQDRAIQSSVIFGNVNASGDLCVRVYDVGNLIDSIDYTVTVVHP